MELSDYDNQPSYKFEIQLQSAEIEYEQAEKDLRRPVRHPDEF